MRVYAALSPELLIAAMETGHLPGDVPVHAVTSALRAQEAALDAAVEEEGLELSALLDAARSSLGLLAGRPRRVVVAAEVGAGVVPSGRPDEAASAVALAAGAVIPLSAVVSAHADAPEAAADVVAALTALEGGIGAGALEAVLERAEDHDLLWYDASELAALADDLGR